MKKNKNKKVLDEKPKKNGKIRLFFKAMFRTIIILLLVLLTLGLIYANVLPHFVSEEYLPNPFKMPEKTINILLLGQDDESQSTDVIIWLNINPRDEKVTAISIPRDTKVHYKNSYFKINAMYVLGGEELIKSKVTQITGQKMDYFVLVNTKGFRNIIDILGGVDVEVTRAMNYDDNFANLHIHFSKGMHHLNGADAEKFIRFRQYVQGDLDRISAQQNFIHALIDQKLKPEYLSKASEILNEIFENVKTDLKIGTIVNYTSFLSKLNRDNIYILTLAGEAQDMALDPRGISYYIYSPEKVKEQVETYVLGNPAKKLISDTTLETDTNKEVTE